MEAITDVLALLVISQCVYGICCCYFWWRSLAHQRKNLKLGEKIYQFHFEQRKEYLTAQLAYERGKEDARKEYELGKSESLS